MRELGQLFISFFKIGLFTFGGGIVMLPMIQRMMVEDYKWMTEEEVVDCIAVAQSLPGVVAINAATYIGNFRKGIWGALAATIGVILPSFVIIILAVIFLNTIGENNYIEGAFTGIKAAACGLILAAAFRLGKQIIKSWFPLLLAAGGFITVAFLNVNVILVITSGALLGCLYTAATCARAKKKENV